MTKSFHVGNGGRSIIPPQSPYPVGRHPEAYSLTWQGGRTLDDHQIVYITRGKGIFESAGLDPVSIQAGDVFLLFPGIWHRYEPLQETGWDEHYVGFKGPQAAHAFNDFGFRVSQPVLHVGHQPVLMEVFNRIMDELEHERIGYRRLLAGHVYELMAQICTLLRRQSFSNPLMEEVVQRARVIMLERTDTTLDMKELAKELAVGYSWFRRAFREYAGISPAQYHLQLRLNKARNLLFRTRLPISRIALDTGFDSAAYFSRIFKRKSGQTPFEFRAAQQVG
jgi:AraC-like DNA-binding protein